MSIIAANELSKSFGAQDVFNSVSLTLPNNARVALVGPNGIGKTTLLQIIAGLDTADAGTVQRRRNLRVGYLPQEISSMWEQSLAANMTPRLLCLQALDDLIQKENRLQEIERQMAAGPSDPALLDTYARLQHEFDRRGGFSYEARIKQVLRGLGFKSDEFDLPLGRFSGGERMRALLAKLLLEEPEMLILDEPTNHLDIQAVEWLESWLKTWPAAVLVVSHDRYFLDRTIQTVWELTAAGLETYRGNYSAYVKQRSARLERIQKEYSSQQEHFRKEQDYINRNIAGQNTRQAQGRRRRLERMKRDELIARPQQDQAVRIHFEANERSGDKVIEAHNLSVGYADAEQELFNVPELRLERGECVALIGPNGAGKTTFIRTLLEEIEPLAGSLRLGANIKVGYFAQTHADMDPNTTILEAIQDADPGMKRSEIRNFLAAFLFQGDRIEKRIAQLSGGERGRLALAILVLEGANLLLLDEPTNHLDIPSQEILQSALMDFPGTILLISHDRYLIRALATQVWVVGEEVGQLAIYKGGYLEYLEERQKSSAEDNLVKSKRRGKRSKPAGYGRIKREISALETEIEELEALLADLSRKLEAPGDVVEEIRSLGERYQEVEAVLASKLSQWDELSTKLTVA